MVDFHRANLASIAYNAMAQVNRLVLIPEGVESLIKKGTPDEADSAMATLIGGAEELFKCASDLALKCEELSKSREWSEDGDAKYYVKTILPKLKNLSARVEHDL